MGAIAGAGENGGTLVTGTVVDKSMEILDYALLARFSQWDGVLGVEMIFFGDSEYITEFSNYNAAVVYLSYKTTGDDGVKITKYVDYDGGYTEVPSARYLSGGLVIWEDFTVAPEPTEEPAEPTEEPIDTAETEETEEPIISEEPVEESEETEAPEIITPEEPVITPDEPDKPAESEPAPSSPAAPAQTATSANKGNPDTGVAASVVPLLIAGAGVVLLTRKKK